MDFVVDDMNFSVSDITGATSLTSGLASTDEFVINDAGVLKRMDTSVLQTYMQNNLTFTTDTNTTYSAGTNISLSGTTFNVDDAFLVNNANDTTTGTITAGGFTTAGIVDGVNFKVNGGQGSDGQVLTSTGSGVAWENAAGGGASAIGDLSDAITTATSNIGLGSGALDSLTATSGNYNVALGIDAGTAITTGDRNTTIGYDAGDSITTGSNNVAIGSNALDGSTTGSESNNVAIGYQAIGGPLNGGSGHVAVGYLVGDAITSANQCTLMGYLAGSSITTGNFNTGLGANSLFSVTTGTNNTAVGYEAGFGFDTESHNVAVGYRAFRQQSGTHSVAIGAFSQYGAGAANVGDYNVSVGGYSLEKITSGDNNVVMGYEAGELVTTGSSNLLIGHTAGDNITAGSNNVVIGAADVPSATGDDQLSISSGDGGVTWITGDSNGGIASKAKVVAVSSNTTLTEAQSGSYVYWTAGSCTLPTSATVGTQFTIFNNTGSSATVGLGTNNSIVSNWATNAAVADNEATSYICVSATNWVQVG